MKNYIYYYCLLCSSVVLLTGCDYLEGSPYHWATAEDVFGAENSYLRPVNQTYSYIFDGFNRVNNAFLDAATDDGMSTISTSNIHKLAQGYISAQSPIENNWNQCYQGIRQALYAQENLKEIPLVLQNMTEEQIQELKNIYSAELDCLRALFEFDLLKHYGGFPIVDQVYNLGDTEVDEISRSSFAQCVQHIVDLCDKAAAVLGVYAQGGTTQYGRMTKPMAMAIKAKTLVYAASPLFNQAGNANPLLGYTDLSDLNQRWKDAAQACWDVIDVRSDGKYYHTAGSRVYTLFHSTGTTYEALANTSPNWEYILFKTAAQANSFENRHFPPSLSNNQNSGGGTVPTQDLVDAFTMSDGSDYVHDASGDPKYTQRDPRFVTVIAYDGFRYNNAAARTVYTHVGDGATIDALNAIIDRSTTTGYYLGKFCKKSINFANASPGTSHHLFPMIRLADIYLMYAEAMNWAYGVDADPEGYGLTAREAVQTIRTRVGFPANDKFLDGVSTPEQMMEKIKQERRVELCFEEARYFDLRRWMDGDKLNQPVHGIRIENNGGTLTYDYFVADARRKFETRMYYHPIPIGVIQKSGGVIMQNPGW